MGQSTETPSCILTACGAREADLLRLVRAPDGTLCPDFTGKLMGDAVWICARRTAIERALASRLLHKSFTPEARVPPDLAAQIAVGWQARLMGRIGLMRRAGKLRLGQDEIAAAIGKNQLAHVVTASDAGEKSRAKMQAFCARHGAAHIIFAARATLAAAVGGARIAHIGIIGAAVGKRLFVDITRLKAYENSHE